MSGLASVASALPIVAEIVSAIVAMVREARTPDELRKRLADGISRGDIVSDDALAIAVARSSDVSEFIKHG